MGHFLLSEVPLYASYPESARELAPPQSGCRICEVSGQLGQDERASRRLDLAQLYSPLKLLIVEGEGLVTSCLPLPLSLSRLSLSLSG